MQIQILKQRLHSYIDSIEDENTLINLLNTAEGKSENFTNESEYLSEDDYKELLSLVNEPPEKDTMPYGKFKSSLSKWFTK